VVAALIAKADCMWLFFDGGFVSVVRKPGDRRLCVRARVAADLDRFRAYCPELSAVEADAGTDYPFRCWASRAAVARAAGQVVRGISYPNFKDRVAEVLGGERAVLCGRVWSTLLALAAPPSTRPARRRPPSPRGRRQPPAGGKQPHRGGSGAVTAAGGG